MNEEYSHHTRYTITKRQKSKCLAASVIIEIFLIKQHDGDIFTLSGEINSPYIHFIQNNLNNSEAISLSGWITKCIKLTGKECALLEDLVIERLQNKDLVQLAAPLLDSDLLNTTAGVKTKEYHMNPQQRQLEIEYLKADLFEAGNVDDETVALLWLLEQSGMIKDIFSNLEIKELEQIKNNLFTTNKLAAELFPIETKTLHYRLLNGSLNLRTSLLETKFGMGFNNRNPYLYRKGSIFIETEELFSSSSKSLNSVLEKLQANGHTCIVKSQGKVPLIEIDGVLYEFVPDMVTYGRAPVSGVRLRKYKM